ncbi:hypothetical protein HD806DRAFT_525287 [Xylariaceae sp. AK1471]|nr:hypothetical protein HD806DRAFT_525287 [Xylariaceae sp. AK1471]
MATDLNYVPLTHHMELSGRRFSSCSLPQNTPPAVAWLALVFINSYCGRTRELASLEFGGTTVISCPQAPYFVRLKHGILLCRTCKRIPVVVNLTRHYNK